MAKINGKKNIFFMGLTSFFMDISSEMIFPILPLFLSNVLGLNKALIGLIEGLAESSASILKVFSGWLSDKFRKRKPLAVFGYGLSALTKPLFAIATNWYFVLFARFSDRVGKGIRTSPRDALIADSSVKTKRGAAFGFHRMMDTMGAIIGTLIAFFILSRLVDGYRIVFWLAFIPAAIAVAVIWIFVKEKKITRPSKPLVFKWSIFDSNYKKFVLISILFSIVNFSYVFFILKVEELGVALAIIPLVYLLYNIVYASSALPLGKLSDKIGRKKIIFVGYILFALITFGMAFANNVYHAWILLAIYGLFMAINETVPKAFISSIVKPEYRATGLGVYHTGVGLALLPASLIAGSLWEIFSSQVVFMVAAVVSVIAAALLIFFVKEK